MSMIKRKLDKSLRRVRRVVSVFWGSTGFNLLEVPLVAAFALLLREPALLDLARRFRLRQRFTCD